MNKKDTEQALRAAIRRAYKEGQSLVTIDRIVDQEWVRHQTIKTT